MNVSESRKSSIPSDAKTLKLADGTKVPLANSRAHLDAQPGPPPTEGNYGIVLDNKFIAVDVDRPDLESELPSLPETWMQQTRRGWHYLYRVPEGLDLHNKKFNSGDIKARGYIVGPGSKVGDHTYSRTNDLEPAPAPEWLIEVLRQKEVNAASPAEEREGIPEGEHDEFIHRLASWLRGTCALQPDTIKRVLAEGPTAALLGGRPEDPYTEADFERIAKSVGKYEAERLENIFNTQGWPCAADLTLAGPPKEWWVYGFVPKGELVGVYGPGAAGKSTWGSWLASEVTKRGSRFAFMGVEEPFERFAWRSLLTGAVPELMFAIPDASRVKIPNDKKALSEALKALQIEVLYIDSIYTHFDGSEGLMTSERARKCLGALAEIAMTEKITIVYVFHENKGGAYSGSTEMKDVPRALLHATREPGGPMKLRSIKNNLKDVEYALEFNAHEVACADPFTGEVQQEFQEDGTLATLNVRVIQSVTKVGLPPTSVTLDDIEDPLETLAEFERDYPGLSVRTVAEKLGWSKSKVAQYRQILSN